VKAETDALYADLRRHLTTGGLNGGPAVTPPPATIMSRLTEAQQDAVTAQIDANIEGRSTSTDPQTWYAIRQGLTADDANERERWAAKNLVQFMGRLSAEDYAALETLQASVRSNDGGADQSRLQAITRMADHALRSVGIDPTPWPDAPPDSDAEQAARFHRALQGELSAFENKDRMPTERDAQDIIDRLMEAAVKGGWLKLSDQYGVLPDDVNLVLQPMPKEVADESLGIQLGAAFQADTSSPSSSDDSERREDSNIVQVTGGDKKKDNERIRSPGSGGRGASPDDEIPPLKQINPLAIPGGGGGGFRLPRSSPSSGGAAAKPAQAGTPAPGGAGKSLVGSGDSSSTQDGTTAATTFVYGPDNRRVPVPPGLNDEEFQLFKYGLKKRLEWDSQTTRRILFNLDMQVDRFLGSYRQGRITKEFPTQFRAGTLRELYDSPASAAKTKAMKLLRDGRFERE
jgi:hypothetical protein